MAIVESPSPALVVERVEFSGTGGEYFRIWIVNLALSILTLGIYSAWAKVRRMQYFYGNARVAGHAFAYHGEPLAILKGRLIGVAALGVYIAISEFAPKLGFLLVIAYVIGVPWIVTRARMFQMRMTSWRGVRFNFNPDYRGAFRVMILAPLLALLSLGFALPWAVRQRYRWLVANSAYGTTAFENDAALKPYVMVVLRTIGIALVVVLVVIAALAVLGGLFGLSLIGQQGTEPPGNAVGWMIATLLPMYLLFLVGSYTVYAYWRRSILNLVLPSTKVGPLRLASAISARRLAWVYATNIVGIVLTVGLYMPWAQVRAAKCVLESTGFAAEGPVEAFVSDETGRTSALGEEVGELFDVDIGL